MSKGLLQDCISLVLLKVCIIPEFILPFFFLIFLQPNNKFQYFSFISTKRCTYPIIQPLLWNKKKKKKTNIKPSELLLINKI